MSRTGIAICTLLIATIAIVTRNWFVSKPSMSFSHAVPGSTYYCEPDTERYSLIFLRSANRPESAQERHVRTKIFPQMEATLRQAMPASIEMDSAIVSDLSCKDLVPTGEMREPSAIVVYHPSARGEQREGYIGYYNISDRFDDGVCNGRNLKPLAKLNPESSRWILRIRDDLIDTSAGASDLPGIVKWTGNQVRAFGTSCALVGEEVRVINGAKFKYWWDLSEKQKKILEPLG